jgi:6-pyruvoyltetrahydropterin/6-carboxytetrahydropterin synthase
MSTISVKTHFAAGHRILGLTGEGEKCRNIHGHTFHVTWVFEQHPSLEFGELKIALRGVVRRHFDHSFILDRTDDFARYLNVNNLRHYLLDGPPTTEAIAAEIARLSIERLTTVCKDGWKDDEKKPLYPDATLLKVLLDEGPDNNATWTKPPLSVEEAFALAGIDYQAATRGEFLEMRTT